MLDIFLTERICIMDNQNNQNGYTNFNGYQESQQPEAAPVTPAEQPTIQPNVYQQTPYNPYQTTVQQETKHKSLVLGILSIVLPIISCTYLSPVGIILGLIGVIRNKKSAVSWVGLVISVLLLIYLAFSLYLYFNPDVTRSILESSGMNQGEVDDFMNSFFAYISSRL